MENKEKETKEVRFQNRNSEQLPLDNANNAFIYSLQSDVSSIAATKRCHVSFVDAEPGLSCVEDQVPRLMVRSISRVPADEVDIEKLFGEDIGYEEMVDGHVEKMFAFRSSAVESEPGSVLSKSPGIRRGFSSSLGFPLSPTDYVLVEADEEESEDHCDAFTGNNSDFFVKRSESVMTSMEEESSDNTTSSEQNKEAHSPSEYVLVMEDDTEKLMAVIGKETLRRNRGRKSQQAEDVAWNSLFHPSDLGTL